MSDVKLPNDELIAKLGDVRASTRPNLEISRHVFQGEPTYVVRDPVTGQTHRFSGQDYQLFISIDQSRTLKESLMGLIERKRLTMDEASDFFRFVVHLHQMGLLTLPLSDGATLFKRFQAKLDAQKKGKIFKLLFMKVPLVKPDQWLAHNQHWIGFLFSLRALLVWFMCMCVCGFLLLSRWQEFVSPLGTMLAMSNVPMLWLLLVSLKAFHEMGHAFACKHFGGKVPEMGAFIMMGTPCAYVDASSSWGFPNRWHRMIVAMAGMYFESIGAMIAVLVWLMTDTGLIHSAAQYAIVLSTVVTIGFNANPLMRYDGYFILCDFLNAPNLHRDAKAITMGFIKWLLFGVPTKPDNLSRPRRIAMTAFGGMCMMYQVTVSTGIATLFALSVPVVGPLIALSFVSMPLFKLARGIIGYVATSKELVSSRIRAIVVTSSLATAAVFGLFIIPLPAFVRSHGVVHRLEEQSIRAGVDGFLVQTLVQDGASIDIHQPLYQLENIELESRRDEVLSQIKQLQVQMQKQMMIDKFAAEQLRLSIESAERELVTLDSQLEQLQVTSDKSGQIALPVMSLQNGKYLRKGESLGKVCDGPWTVRVHLTAEQWADVQPAADQSVRIHLIGTPENALFGRIERVIPAGSKKIDEAALTHLGGGNIAVSPDMIANETFYELIIRVDSIEGVQPRLGMTASLLLPTQRYSAAEFFYRRALQLVHRIRQVG